MIPNSMMPPPTNMGGYYLYTYGTYTHDDGSTDNIYVSDYYPHSDAYEVQLFHSRTKLLRFGHEMQAKYTLHPDQGAAAKAWLAQNSNAHTPYAGATITYTPPTPGTGTYIVTPGGWSFYRPSHTAQAPQQAAAKCECGSEKVGSPAHSTWCPKHTK